MYLFIDLHMINIHHTHIYIYVCVNIHNAYIFICGGFLSHLAIPSSQVIRSWPGRQLRGRGSAQAVPEEVHGGRRPWGWINIYIIYIIYMYI